MFEYTSRDELKLITERFCFFSAYTWLNHKDVRWIIGIEDVLTTEGNGDGEQKEIEQMNTPTKIDILQWNMLMRIWIAWCYPIDLILNNECAVTARKSVPSRNGRIIWHQRF